MIRAGITESVAMAITGHETDAMFRRYAIVADEDTTAALEQTEKYRSA
jgi:hypothetical protein